MADGKQNAVVESPAIVIDNGTGVFKAGFSGKERPSVRLPSLVGVPKKTGAEVVIGKDLFTEQGQLIGQNNVHLVNPMTRGVISDWNALEMLWNHLFSVEMAVSPTEHPLIIADPPLNPTTNREKMAELAFEVFDVPSMHVAYQPILSLYSSGRITGTVIDAGDGMCYCTPCYHGYTLPHATYRLDVAGQDLDRFLLKLLRTAGYVFGEQDLWLVKDIKEKCCFVVQDVKMAQRGRQNRVQFKLPDGQIVHLKNECFLCPEALFQPEYVDCSIEGLPQLFHTSMRQCDSTVVPLLMENVILAGGSTLLKGYPERMADDICRLSSNPSRLKTFLHPEAENAVWQGGSILASLKAFQTMWVHQQDYNESGPFVVHRKCY
uniref:actin, cytoplasmic A3-like n=1 Tax=Myxine glutinosa TaxID=7769 RepID=UPI00358F1AFE